MITDSKTCTEYKVCFWNHYWEYDKGFNPDTTLIFYGENDARNVMTLLTSEAVVVYRDDNPGDEPTELFYSIKKS